MIAAFKRLGWAGRGFLLTTWVAAALTTYWIMDRGHPVELANEPHVLTPVVRPGEAVEVRWCVNRYAVFATRRLERMYDGANIEVGEELTGWRDAVGMPTEPGKPDCYVTSMVVPARAKPGWARYRVIVSWRHPYNLVHLLWPIVRVFPDQPFSIATVKG